MDREKLIEALKAHGLDDEAINKAITSAEGAVTADELTKSLETLKEAQVRETEAQTEALTKALDAASEGAQAVAEGADKIVASFQGHFDALNKGMTALIEATQNLQARVDGLSGDVKNTEEAIEKAQGEPLAPKARTGGAQPVASPLDQTPEKSALQVRNEVMAKAQSLIQSSDTSRDRKVELATAVSKLSSGIDAATVAKQHNIES